MHYLGLISLYFACAFTLLALFTGQRFARRANFLAALAVGVSTLALVFAFVRSDFRLAYVARNSARNLPVIYKVSGLWAGQSGSLLLWLFIMSLFSLAVQTNRKFREMALDIPVNAVINAVRLIFIILLLFVTSPFAVLEDPPYNGSGLNPMLQSIGMVVHPPLLFIGFSGFVVPFALAAARLWAGDTSEDWLDLARPWALFAWTFLTAGIVTGGRWAYNELGWGGYWAWDPVENASLLPWLTGTALILTLQLRRGHPGRKRWGYILTVLSFALTIFATFLTRSGILDSMHAFAGGILGPIFLAVLVFIIVFSVGLAWRRGDCLKGRGPSSAYTGTALDWAVQGGNVLLLLILAGVLLGTMFPLLSKPLWGREIVLDAGFFNQVTVPIFLALFFLMGLAPVLAESRGEWSSIVKRIWLPLGAATAAGILVQIVFGGGTAPCLAFGIAAFGLAAHIQAIFRRDGKGLSAGSTLVHIGFFLMLIGVAGSSVYTDELFVSVEPGEAVQFGGYTAVYPGLKTRYGMDRYVVGTTLKLSKNDREVGELTSEKTFHENRAQPSTKVGIFSTVRGDLYLNLAGWQGQRAQLHLQRFALVSWIWCGAWVVYLGAALRLINLSKQV